jgi:hypothetical protein
MVVRSFTDSANWLSRRTWQWVDHRLQIVFCGLGSCLCRLQLTPQSYRSYTSYPVVLCTSNLVPTHGTCHGSSITQEACIRREIWLPFRPRVQNTLFHSKASKCRPPASQQTSYFVTIYLHTTKLLPWNIKFLFECYLSIFAKNVDCSHKLYLVVPPQIIIQFNFNSIQ